jgi:hypothetical protein
MEVKETKFKIGDLVQLKNNELYTNEDERIFVVRSIPKLENNMLKGSYKIISNFCDGIKNVDVLESNIKKCNCKVPYYSAIGVLQRIIKNDLDVNKEVWEKLVKGKIILDDRVYFKEVYNLQESNTWGFFVNTLSSKVTGLPVNLYVSCANCNHAFNELNDYIYKIRVANVSKISDRDDSFYLSLEEKPRIIIGKSKLSEEDFEKVYNYVAKNYKLFRQALDEEWDYEDLEKHFRIRENI